LVEAFSRELNLSTQTLLARRRLPQGRHLSSSFSSEDLSLRLPTPGAVEHPSPTQSSGGAAVKDSASIIMASQADIPPANQVRPVAANQRITRSPQPDILGTVDAEPARLCQSERKARFITAAFGCSFGSSSVRYDASDTNRQLATGDGSAYRYGTRKKPRMQPGIGPCVPLVMICKSGRLELRSR
jgi:hypothetical protein